MSLSASADLVATIALATLVLIFGLGRGERLSQLWAQKRYEFVLLLAMACAHRAAEFLHAAAVADPLHVAQAVASVLCALGAAWRPAPRRKEAGA